MIAGVNGVPPRGFIFSGDSEQRRMGVKVSKE